MNAPQFVQAQVAHENLDWLIDLKGSPQDSSDIRWQVIQSILTLATGVLGIAVGHIVAIQAERAKARRSDTQVGKRIEIGPRVGSD